MANFQTKNKLKYSILVFGLVLFTMLSLALNYVYVLVYERNLYLNNSIATTQTLVNNRTYIVSALQALETIIDNNSGNANYVQMLKIKEKLPQIFLNSDYSITPNLERRFNKLKLDLDDYIKSPNNNKESMLLNLTALKSEIILKLEANKIKYRDLLVTQGLVTANLDLLAKIAMGLFITLILCFYYLLHCLRQENKFKLKDFADHEHSFNNKNFNDKSNLVNKLIEIEHLCQRLNYTNISLLKKISNNEIILESLFKKQNQALEIIQKIGIKNNLTFGLLAELMELNNKIVENLNSINNEGSLIKEDINNNTYYISKIFVETQLMSTSRKESKASELIPESEAIL